MNKNMVHIHLHTIYSIMDSTTNPEDFIKKAVECGMHSICFTEHGNVFNHIKKKQLCEKYGIKMLYGVECYLTKSLTNRVKDNYHTILIAKNKAGIEEINQLLTIASDTRDSHFYYKPAITFEEFINISDNVITTSACLGGALGRLDEDDEWVEKLVNRYDYLEIQPHNYERQIEHNRYMHRLSCKYGKPLISACDVHELNDYKSECRLIWIHKDGTGYEDEDKFDLTFHNYEEVVEMYRKQDSLDMDIILDAIENTNRLSDQCEDYELDYSFKYNHLYENPLQLLQSECYDAYNSKAKIGAVDISREEEYFARIDEEIAVFNKVGMESFILFFSEQSRWEQSNGIIKGFGRGSVCGSLVAYLLDIIDVDPIKWGTVFSRFCNEDRISLGDIDNDYSPSERILIFNHIKERLGEKYTSYIGTFATLNTSGIIDAVGKALNMPLQEVANIKSGYKAIDNKIIMLTKSFENGKITEEEYNSKKESYQKEMEDYLSRFEDLFYYYKGLKGAIYAVGHHASGFLGSPIELDKSIGLRYSKDVDGYISQCDMKNVDSVNYVKYDILGLKTIQVLKETFALAGKKYPKSYEVDWNDKEVFNDMITSPVGIFQMESESTFKYLQEFKPTTVQDITLLTAIIRPSCASFRDKIIKREIHKNPSPVIDEVLKDSYGYLVYQEQQIEFLRKACGFTGAQGDTVRKCVAQDTLVTLANGSTVKIKDINIGDKVLCKNSNDKIVISTVSNKWNNGVKPMMKITTSRGYSIKLTKDHKVFTDCGWKEAKDVCIDDSLFAPLNNLSYNDLLIPNQRPKKNIGYVIGALIGDGYIKENKATLTNSESIIIDTVKDILSEYSRGKDSISFSVNSISGITVNDIYKLNIYGTTIQHIIKKYKLNKLAGDKNIPAEFMNLHNCKPLQQLLAGLFNTDGYVSKDTYIEYATKSKQLATDIKQSLLKLDIYSYIYEKEIKDYGYNMYVVRLTYVNSYINFNTYITPYIVGIKKDKFYHCLNNYRYECILPNYHSEEMNEAVRNSNYSFRSMFNEIEYKENYNKTYKKAKMVADKIYCPSTYKLLLSDITPERVIRIEEVEDGVCYDIEVEGYHNFIADGLIVHNCVGKKDLKTLNEWLPKIESGYVSHSDKSEEEALKEVQEFMKVFIDSASYSFGLNHATAYSMITYLTAYARYYYPKEFITAYLNNATNDEDIVNGTLLATHKGVKIFNPIYGKSKGDYSVQLDGIYKGVKSILNVSAQVGEDLYHHSQQNASMSFLELLRGIDELPSTNSSNIQTLIKVGYFREYGKAKKLSKIYELFKELKGKKQMSKDKCATGIKNLMIRNLKNNVEGFSCTNKLYKFDWYILLEQIWKALPNEDFSLEERIVHELSYLNYIQSEDLKQYKIGSVKFQSRFGSWCVNINGVDYWYDNKSNKELSKGDLILIFNDTLYINKYGRSKNILVDFTVLQLDRRKLK